MNDDGVCRVAPGFIRVCLTFSSSAVASPPQTTSSGVAHYTTVGYLTVYEYYAYGRETNKKRPRVAQMLVLPPFQVLQEFIGAGLFSDSNSLA